MGGRKGGKERDLSNYHTKTKMKKSEEFLFKIATYHRFTDKCKIKVQKIFTGEKST